ncbi:MAG: PKD domain-containing protein [Methanoculleus sp.]
MQFTDTSTGSPTSWSWDFGDEETHTDQNPVHIYKNPGEYDVSHVQRGSASDSVTKTGLIIVDEPNPGLNIELEYQNSVLLGDGDTVEVRVRTTGSNGIPRVSNIMVKAPGESAERARAAETPTRSCRIIQYL